MDYIKVLVLKYLDERSCYVSIGRRFRKIIVRV